MSEPSVLDMPPVPFPEPEVDQFRRDQWAFYCMLGDLLKTHRGQYVAVYNKQPVESGADRLEVVRKVYERFGNVPVFVERVSEEPPPIQRVPRFRGSK